MINLEFSHISHWYFLTLKLHSMEKFTILIPTRDRSDVLLHSIRSCLRLDYENLRIIVSDNFSNDDTYQVVKSFNDKRLEYIKTDKRVSMSTNWEFALSHVNAGWVTIIGDDDALIPGAIERVLDISSQTGVLAIRSNSCGYLWPSLLDDEFGQLSYPLGNGYRVVSAKQMLNRVLNAKDHYTVLPVIYNGGFLHSDLIRRVKEKSSKFFLSPIPDVYTGVLLSGLLEEYVLIDQPLAVNGASKHSGGTAAFNPKVMNDGSRFTEPAEKFIQEIDFPFHKNIPTMKNGSHPPFLHALIYEATLQAKSVVNFPGIDLSPVKQLQIIAAEAHMMNKVNDFDYWKKKFIEKNSIPSDIKTASHLKNLQRFIFSTKVKFNALNKMKVIGNHELPLDNVYEASLVAENYSKNPPNRLSVRYKNISKIVNRIWGRRY